MDNIKLLYYKTLFYIYRKLDEKLTKLLSKTDKIVKAHAGIKQLAEKLKKLDIFDNQKIKNLKSESLICIILMMKMNYPKRWRWFLKKSLIY
ncbi:hypothetical protein MKC73_12595 [[Clostridium] innocuum]|nr:hypothetical protein [[Clostridium] innocuum]